MEEDVDLTSLRRLIAYCRRRCDLHGPLAGIEDGREWALIPLYCVLVFGLTSLFFERNAKDPGLPALNHIARAGMHWLSLPPREEPASGISAGFEGGLRNLRLDPDGARTCRRGGIVSVHIGTGQQGT